MLMSEELVLALGWRRATDEPARHNGLWEVGREYRRLPDFTTSLDACAEAEAEIARRDLTNQYAAELVRLLGPQIFADELTLEGAYTYGNRAILSFDREHRAVFTATGPALFVLITAPPEARVRAMLEVLKG